MAAQMKGTKKPKMVTWWTTYQGRKPRNTISSQMPALMLTPTHTKRPGEVRGRASLSLCTAVFVRNCTSFSIRRCITRTAVKSMMTPSNASTIGHQARPEAERSVRRPCGRRTGGWRKKGQKSYPPVRSLVKQCDVRWLATPVLSHRCLQKQYVCHRVTMLQYIPNWSDHDS